MGKYNVEKKKKKYGMVDVLMAEINAYCIAQKALTILNHEKRHPFSYAYDKSRLSRYVNHDFIFLVCYKD